VFTSKQTNKTGNRDNFEFEFCIEREAWNTINEGLPVGLPTDG
jgi:hypothetical protein